MSAPHRPPVVARWILRAALPRSVRDELTDDLAHAYARPDRARRRLWYWTQVARACWPPTLVALHASHSDPEDVPMPSFSAQADAVRYDVRLALRGFRRRPFFTAMIVATLALGIGANSTMFGLLDQLLFQAPPHITDPDRVALLGVGHLGDDWNQTTQPYVFRARMRDDVSAFADVAAATPTGVVRRTYYPTGRGVTASQVAGSLVTTNYFSVLGVRPELGRFFSPDEEKDDVSPKMAVLGYAYWQRQYGGAKDVVGRAIDIGTSKFTIVGVAPKGFTGTEMRDVDVWLPLGAADGLRFVKGADWNTSTSSQWLLMIARLKPNVTAQQAAAQATAMYRAWAIERNPNLTAKQLGRLDSARVMLESIVPGRSSWTWGLSGSSSDIRVSKLLGAVALVVLLIACANVANLLLVRALGRRREIAVRLALGVSRKRLVSQLVIEGVTLSLIGTAGALIVTSAAAPLVRRWLIGEGAWTAGAIDGRVLAFTILVGMVTGIVTSLVPALQASRADVSSSLKAGAREGSVQRSRTRQALLIAQAALAIVLLAGAGMFVRSLRNVASLDLGLDVEHVLVARVNHSVMNLGPDESRQLFKRFTERVAAVPGVQRAALSDALPFSSSSGNNIFIPGRSLPKGAMAFQYVVTDGYFDALGIRTVMGRVFNETDREGSPLVAVINEAAARQFWPNQNPVGACVQVGADTMPCETIVGIVSNTRRQNLVEKPVPQIYQAMDQLSSSALQRSVAFFGYTVIVHTSGDASNYVESVRRAIQSTGPSIPYANVQTMHEMLRPQTRTWELGARVFSAFGVLALLLAGIGMFSVIAFTIGQRMHEFGVRTALGARKSDLLRLTIVRGVAPAIGGIAIGVALTLLGGRFLESLLFEISPRDPATIATAAAIMLIAAVAASLAPALRASNVDPTIALRSE